ncbi:MAG: polysaccharide deacetylase family protein [Prevotella sp.]|nr:polysaccharide deacetylase family protein [Prevotella sp.]
MILLSFDTEEFDVPREHGVSISLADGMKVSCEGTRRILDVLRHNGVRATFFCTGNFAEHAPELIQRILNAGHEVACHGVDHWQPRETDVALSKQIVERVAGREVYGYRQPRMFPVSDEQIEQAGYRYNSSLNPAFVPGRYMHLTEPRTCFDKGKVMQIPASVTPWLRLPLFWLALHNMPQPIYHCLVRRTLRHDGYFMTYFHPWEFYDLKEHPEFRLPFIIRNNSGQQMVQRLDRLIKMLKEHDSSFLTFNEFYALKHHTPRQDNQEFRI